MIDFTQSQNGSDLIWDCSIRDGFEVHSALHIFPSKSKGEGEEDSSDEHDGGSESVSLVSEYHL